MLLAEVVNGTAVVRVGNLTAGPKTVVVEYSGDGNYTSGYAVGNFTVEQSKVDPDVTVVNQGNGTIVVVVPKDAKLIKETAQLSLLFLKTLLEMSQSRLGTIHIMPLSSMVLLH